MTKGIHHITAIASDAQRTVEFYSKILGLRLVKKSVNQDDPATYHLFFGDKAGHPGMDLTFFIFLPPMQGKTGSGLVTTVSLTIRESALDFWQQRLTQFAVEHDGIVERFGKNRIAFFDPDGLQLELVGVPSNEIDQDVDVWPTPDISSEQAILSFYSASLSVTKAALIEPILTQVFGYEQIQVENSVRVYAVPHSRRANILEVHEIPSTQSINAAGTVHHIAFRADDGVHQLQLRDTVMKLGMAPTEVIDRFYFKSVYFRTPAGILFEIATDGPGFLADEAASELGKKLALPPFLEPYRSSIESNLIPLTHV